MALIKTGLAILSFFVAITLYQIGHVLYFYITPIVTHPSAGLIFIIYYFMGIVLPALFIISFSSRRIGYIVTLLLVSYPFYEWFDIHPLRVILMALSTAISCGALMVANARFYRVTESA